LWERGGGERVGERKRGERDRERERDRDRGMWKRRKRLG
jgi:hypothetical protein